MADILPQLERLDDIREGEYSSFTFESDLTDQEVLVKLEIIESDFPEYILINGATFSGKFENLFTLPPGSLKYRDGLEYGEADSFASLPPKGTVQLYEYNAPRVMLEDFKISVRLTYTEITDPSTEINITKVYTQPIRGDWNVFRQQFINYVR
ncbi:hypothetical protein Acj9p161 [Acinetobacter phage Acj9]|uniref:Uncharacterized protein 5.1 n=1 Tax=Acinetobacter phage Acj9 TaxID=760939 RepID=E5EPU5_9CAUD|nr:hypothetical protein Acj9p161 [Acinetobacter phage Acj9]ADG60061.1 conserved hypothetical protein [Acinetobacter phage Acj9]